MIALAVFSKQFIHSVSAQDSSSSTSTDQPLASILTPEQEQVTFSGAKKYEYQSDIARLMKIVVGNRECFFLLLFSSFDRDLPRQNLERLGDAMTSSDHVS